jgi:hypothetical protein
LIRVVDGDEGFYTLAAKLVAHGRVPYVDFWYQQAPLFPYVYGAWHRVFGASWYGLRILSCLFAIATGVLLYRHVAERLSSRVFAAVAVALYATTPLVFQWFVLVKTYSLSALLLFGGYVLVGNLDRVDIEPARLPWRWALAGACAGLAADVRFVLLPALIAFPYYAWRSTSERRARGRSVVATCTGIVVGLLPSVYFFARGPRRFVNDTLTSQTTRSRGSIDASITAKLRELGDLLSTPHVLIATIAVLTVTLVLVSQRRRVPMAIAIAALLSVGCVIPTPIYTQYFAVVIPFLVVGAFDLVPIVRSLAPRAHDRRGASPLLVLGAATLAICLVVTVQQIDVVRQQHRLFLRPSNVRSVSRAIDDVTRPGELVLATWPGWLYETHTRQLPGLESDFIPGVVANSHLSPARARAFHMLSYAEIERIIRQRRVELVAYSNSFGDPGFASALTAAGYRPLRTVDQVTLYQRAGR